MMRLVLILVLWAGAALAVQPDEILDDPVLEQRARGISAGLRCPVCRNESIDDSNAGVSRDLRLLVRERLIAGDSDTEVVRYITDRYGEYVLLKPTRSGGNIVLWLAGPVVLLLGALAAWSAMRARPAAADRPLSDAEKAQIEDLISRQNQE